MLACVSSPIKLGTTDDRCRVSPSVLTRFLSRFHELPRWTARGRNDLRRSLPRAKDRESQAAFRLRDDRSANRAAIFMRLLASTAAATHSSKRSRPSARQRFILCDQAARAFGEEDLVAEREKSDPAVVAVKLANKAERSAAESVEPRAGTEGNAGQHSTCRAQYRVSVSPALERIRHVRRQTPEVGAVCGKAARTVLCGGRSAMGVPTAIASLAMTT